MFAVTAFECLFLTRKDKKEAEISHANSLKKTFNQNHTIMEHVFQHAFYIPLHQKK